jgi:hypothetical protein
VEVMIVKETSFLDLFMYPERKGLDFNTTRKLVP